MWIVVGLLPAVIVLAVIIAGAVALFRPRTPDAPRIGFPTVVGAYVALAMLASLVMTAVGAGLLLKTGFAAAGGRDFSYNAQTYAAYDPSTAKDVQLDPSDAEIRDDVATGLSLTFVGLVLFVPHAVGAALVRRRPDSAPSPLVSRTYALLGLGTATIAFVVSGAIALDDIVRRYLIGADERLNQYQLRHPGEAIALAITMLPLALWFGWRLWQEFAGPNSPGSEPLLAASSPLQAAS
jgi:hypothetical protein